MLNFNKTTDNLISFWAKNIFSLKINHVRRRFQIKRQFELLCFFHMSEVHRLEILFKKDETAYTTLSCTFSNLKYKTHCTPDADTSLDPVLTHLSSCLVTVNFQSVCQKRPSLAVITLHLLISWLGYRSLEFTCRTATLVLTKGLIDVISYLQLIADAYRSSTRVKSSIR